MAAVGQAGAGPVAAGRQWVGSGAAHYAAGRAAPVETAAGRVADVVAAHAPVCAARAAADVAHVGCGSAAHVAAAVACAARQAWEIESRSRAVGGAVEWGPVECTGDSRGRGHCGDSCQAGPGGAHSAAVDCTRLC